MQNAYDRKAYPYAIRFPTHPLRLGVPARLMGRATPSLNASRVLEIGAGDGVNLLGMAMGAPRTEFVGVDYSQTAVEQGRQLIAEVGLANVRLECVDLCAFGAPAGSFDYIVAHGVYAWIPENVRDALMALVGKLLSPTGVAMISYNALPGCAPRQAIRELLLGVVGETQDPEERLAKARATLAHFCAHWSKSEAFSATLLGEAQNLLERPDGVLFHDELGDVYAPRYFGQVVEHARRQGLDYLCDADPALFADALWEREIWSKCLPFGGEDFLRFEQARDFLETRSFRRSLFCRAGAPLERRFALERMRGLYVDSAALPVESAPGERKFKTPQGIEMATNNPLVASTLDRLGAIFPAALPVEEFPSTEWEALARLFCGGVVELTTEPFAVAVEIDARPKASRLARVLLAQGGRDLPSLRHSAIWLEDEKARRFMSLLDGSRDVDAIARDVAGPGATEAEIDAAKARAGEGLKTFLRLGLLER